jgi:hypothetical protein
MRLKALETFKCVGPECISSCCTVPWRITVEPAVVERWHALPQGETRDRLLRHLRPATPVADEPERPGYMFIDMGSEHRCPHLGADRLCSIQAELGEEFMGKTCRDYPRTVMDDGAVTIQSGLLSCPELARLVLFGQEDINPFQVERTPLPDTAPPREADRLHAIIARMLRTQCEDTSLPLHIRLYGIGQSLVDIALLARAGGVNEISLARMHAGLASRLRVASAKVRNQQIPRNHVGSGSFWRAMYIFAFDSGIIGEPSSQPEADFNALMMRKAPADKDFIAITQQVARLRKPAIAALRQPPYQAALERYIRVQFVNRGFPDRPVAENYIASYLNAFIAYAIVQMRLWLRYATRRELLPDDLVEAVYVTEQRLGQGKTLVMHLNEHPELLRIDQYLEIFADSC